MTKCNAKKKNADKVASTLVFYIDVLPAPYKVRRWVDCAKQNTITRSSK